VRTALDLFLLLDGLTLIAASRLLADHLKVAGDTSTPIRLLGLADDPASATYRFATSVLSGAVLSGAAVFDLFA
jgi:hypothetical protein